MAVTVAASPILPILNACVANRQDAETKHGEHGHDCVDRQARRSMQEADTRRSKGANRHLQKTQQGRSTADVSAEWRECNSGRVWMGHPAKRQVQKKKRDLRGQAVPIEPGAREYDNDNNSLADQRGLKNLLILIPL